MGYQMNGWQPVRLYTDSKMEAQGGQGLGGFTMESLLITVRTHQKVGRSRAGQAIRV